MLPDRICRLLTAYVDGELPAQHCKLVQSLLHRSAEARALLGRLQQDAAELRRLPRAQVEAQFARQVLQALATQPGPPSPCPPVRSPVPLSAWLGWATAATVLFLISAGSYLYFAEVSESRPALADVRRPWETTAHAHAAPEPDIELLTVLPVEQKPTSSAGMGPRPESPSSPAPGALARGPAGTLASDPVPVSEPAKNESSTESLLTAPNPKRELFKEVADPPGLAVFFRLRDLDQEKAKRRLQEEFHRDRAFRLELSCTETAKALVRLRAAFEAEGVLLLIDPDAQDWLTLRLKTNYVLYSEHLTADELVRILHHASHEDQKAEAKRRGDGQFDKLAVSRMTVANQKELSQLLGIEPTQLPMPRPRTAFRPTRPKPLSALPEDRVLQFLKGQDSSRPEEDVPPAKTLQRRALVLAYDPLRPRPATSQEVKLFLHRRQEPRPATMQLLLIVRTL